MKIEVFCIKNIRQTAAQQGINFFHFDFALFFSRFIQVACSHGAICLPRKEKHQ